MASTTPVRDVRNTETSSPATIGRFSWKERSIVAGLPATAGLKVSILVGNTPTALENLMGVRITGPALASLDIPSLSSFNLTPLTGNLIPFVDMMVTS